MWSRVQLRIRFHLRIRFLVVFMANVVFMLTGGPRVHPSFSRNPNLLGLILLAVRASA